MATLYYDTETTGKFDFYLPVDHADQPDMVQLGMILKDEKEIARVSILVVPGKEVSPEAAAIHGISTEYARQYGVHPRVAFWTFHSLALRAKTLIAYNNQFDDGVLACAYARDKSIDYGVVKSINHRCAMRAATPLCKIPGRNGGYKWPRLEEAYKILVDPAGFDGAHDALTDVVATAAVWEKISSFGVRQ